MGLFDQLKVGTINLFGGDQGGGRALQEAGAAAMAGGGDFGESLGTAVMAGKAAGDRIRAEGILEQNRRELEALTLEVGMDREGLQRLFLTALGNGQIDEAKALSEVIKSMPTATATKANFFEETIKNPETGRWERVSLTRDPYDGRITRREVIGEVAGPASAQRRPVQRELSAEVAQLYGYEKAGKYDIIYDEAGQIESVSPLALEQEEMIPAMIQRSLTAAASMKEEDWAAMTGIGASLEMNPGEGKFDAFLRIAGRLATDATTEQAVQRAKQVVLGIQNAISGKQMTASERQYIESSTVPTFGHENETALMMGRATTRFLEIMAQGGSKHDGILAIAEATGNPVPQEIIDRWVKEGWVEPQGGDAGAVEGEEDFSDLGLDIGVLPNG
jgi:hypothetical protein